MIFTKVFFCILIVIAPNQPVYQNQFAKIQYILYNIHVFLTKTQCIHTNNEVKEDKQDHHHKWKIHDWLAMLVRCNLLCPPNHCCHMGEYFAANLYYQISETNTYFYQHPYFQLSLGKIMTLWLWTHHKLSIKCSGVMLLLSTHVQCTFKEHVCYNH